MLWHWPVMGLVFLAGALLYTAVSIWLALGYVAPIRRVAAESDSRLGGSLADALTCNAVVKSTAAEVREDARLGGVLDIWQANMLRAWYASIHTGVAQNAMLIVLQAALVGGALWLWSRGQASAGDVAYVLTSFLLVGRWLRDVGMQLRIAQQAANDMERLIEYHRTPADIADRPDAAPLAVAGGAICFERVRFHYGNHATPLFDELSVTIAAGERVALVGHSGSGKTTFVKLLQRLHEIQGGRILIDGQDVARATLASLREAIALVPQEPVLFHRSLAENIAYAPARRQPRPRSCARRGWRMPTASSTGCRRATPPWSASAASSCRAASASGSRSPARSWPTGRSWSWTRRPPRSTARPSS